MKALNHMAIAITLVALSSGRLYANHKDGLDSNTQIAELSDDAINEKMDCCQCTSDEQQARALEKEVRGKNPTPREWSGRDR